VRSYRDDALRHAPDTGRARKTTIMRKGRELFIGRFILEVKLRGTRLAIPVRSIPMRTSKRKKDVSEK